MRSKTIAITLLCLFITNITIASACTTAIVSAKGTPDGQPILWKHRDAGNFDNKIIFDDKGKFSYLGLINSNDAAAKEVWAGVNEVGFAIMNAASYNINIGDTTKAKDQEGLFMKRALQSCSSLDEFEAILVETNSKRGIEANFGVIDAQGGAAYYETGNHSFVKLDVNDPAIAPFGYLVRTNFSSTGSKDKGYGYIRYQSAEHLFHQEAAQNSISPQFIFQEVDRSLYHSLTNIRLDARPWPDSKDEDYFVSFRDYINRYSSTASFIVQGVKPGEDVKTSVAWTLLGFPPCAVAIPLWVAAGENLPAVITAKDSANAELCDKALELKHHCFPVSRGSGNDYLNLAKLINHERNGYMQQIRPLEEEVISKTGDVIGELRKNGFDKQRVIVLYRWIDNFIRERYLKIE
ncbi:hypothetical protein JXB12_04305 [candidate division KSB1 bacterium]|nr:hypothetical protein [candidate division KSB1 bacterium]